MRAGVWFGALACAVALTGCNSCKVVQSAQFADDGGRIVVIDYLRAENVHVNTFRSPANGKQMEFKSKLAVHVTLPDGDTFKAWQCMNFYGKGTSYKTDDDEWLLVASGFTCRIGQLDENTHLYTPIFEGVLCNTPYKAPEKRDERWKAVRAPEKKAN